MPHGPWGYEDLIVALEARRDGTTLADLGRRFGVGAERMRMVLVKAARLERDSDAVAAAIKKGPDALVRDMFPLVPVRVANCLANARLEESPLSVFFHITKWDLLRVKNFGRKSLLELTDALQRFHVELNPARQAGLAARDYAVKHVVRATCPLNGIHFRARCVTACGLSMPVPDSTDGLPDCDACHEAEAKSERIAP